MILEPLNDSAKKALDEIEIINEAKRQLDNGGYIRNGSGFVVRVPVFQEPSVFQGKFPSKIEGNSGTYDVFFDRNKEFEEIKKEN